MLCYCTKASFFANVLTRFRKLDKANCFQTINQPIFQFRSLRVVNYTTVRACFKHPFSNTVPKFPWHCYSTRTTNNILDLLTRKQHFSSSSSSSSSLFEIHGIITCIHNLSFSKPYTSLPKQPFFFAPGPRKNLRTAVFPG